MYTVKQLADLAEVSGRAQLWRYHIPSRLPVQLNDQDWATLVADTEGLAGGDILNIVVYAAAMALEREGVTCQITGGISRPRSPLSNGPNKRSARAKWQQQRKK